MTAILYPVATNAEQALAAPVGRAARQSEAAARAGEAVAFVTDLMGPAFATREAALDAYAGRVEDERTGKAPEPQDRFCALVERMAEGAVTPKAVEPACADGRRWPQPPPAPKTVWRLAVSYWRVGTAARPLEPPQAREARRGGGDMDPETLRAITRTPLRPTRPQQALDIGLFETRPPEAPHIVMPDE